MAGELYTTTRLRFRKGDISVDKTSAVTGDVAGNAYSAGVQEIPTTSGGTAISIGSAVGTKGMAFFRNLDDENYVELGVQDGSMNFIAFAKLKAGQAALVPLASSTIYALANTAAVLLDVVVIED